MNSEDERGLTDGEPWYGLLVDNVDLSDDPNEDCAFPEVRQTKKGRAVHFKLKDGRGRPFKVCFEGEVPFKNWDQCETKEHGTLVGVIDAPPGQYKYSVEIDGKVICDPIVWVQH